MRQLRHSRPNSALAVAILALVAAMAGTAVAGSDVQSSAVSKKEVKKVAKKQAKKQINKLAPGLSVASAETANSANPIAFAQVSASGAVNPANSKGVSSGNVTAGNKPGIKCFKGLGFTPKGAVVTVDGNDSGDDFATFSLGRGSTQCSAGTQGFVSIFDLAFTSENAGFFIVFYN
jgi:hypothetical protein